MAIKAILLDLDGTILDTLDDLTDSVNFALVSCGFPTRTKEEIRTIVGNGVVNLITRALPEGVTEDEFKACLNTFKKHYETNKTNKTAPYDGIIPLLEKLKKAGYLLAIVSNKHNDAVQSLTERFFGKYVAYAIGNTDTIPKKPNPDMVYYTLEKLGVTPSEAAYVGDSEVDIETAKNSGIPCVSVAWGFRDEDVLTKNGARLIVNTPDELFTAVTGL